MAAGALVALAAWPAFVAGRVGAQLDGAGAPHPALTAAPVTRDDLTRNKVVAFYERRAAAAPDDQIIAELLAAQYLQRFRETGDIGDVERAERFARRSLKAQPVGNVGAEQTLASCLLTYHDFRGALRVERDAARYQPKNRAIIAQEASLEMELGDFDAAAELLARIPTSRFEDATRDTIMARYDEVTGHLADARVLLARAMQQQDTMFEAPAESRAGELAFEAGQLDEAIRDEHDALAIFPNDARAYNDLARFESAAHAWRAALAAATRGAELVPLPETLGYAADAQRALGDVAGAERTQDLIFAVERIGNAHRVNDRLLAIYYTDHRVRLADALRIALRELRLRDDPYTEDTIAWAAAANGRWALARGAIAKALRYDTEDARLQFHAGMIARHFGDRDEARRRLERALQLNPHFDATGPDEARRALASL